MCGRFALNTTDDALKAHFHLKTGMVVHPRYNIAPSTFIPIIKMQNKGIDFSRWGFVPSWFKEAPSTSQGHINARMESIAEKPTFKSAFQTHRCLIPATGYFEWRTFGEKKQPYYIYLKNHSLFAFAGIWSNWDTCAIVTLDAPSFLQPLHDRMPAIVSPKHYAAWLQTGVLKAPQDHLLPLVEKDIGIYAVTSRMNHPQFDHPMCIQPISITV